MEREKEESEERRNLYPGWQAERILKLIPYDGWISSQDIATKVSTTSSIVDSIIFNRLLHTHVEQRKDLTQESTCYLYRRIANVARARDVPTP